MQLTHILTVALLAVGATAMPAPAPEAALEGRTLGLLKCLKSGGKYDWLKHTCTYPQPECPYGKKWDDYKKKCDYPPYDPPKCYEPEHGWCSKSKYEYTSYNKDHVWCKKDGWNKVWCSNDHDAPEKCKQQY
ncbi:hypothetical protein BKA64DRAFT_639142 [Cadophora sp. MPI-SDFR-AT-0126]|nr:hypothetical protein BKA64DRAFT_639142 [Leotiomycetes sp. MPI-SDFR-AT-0126]